MLSFFRKKSSESDLNSKSLENNQNVVLGTDALLTNLGYNDMTELKDTIYGKLFYF